MKTDRARDGSVDYSNLSDKEKEFYAEVLNLIFQGTIGNVTFSQISPNIAQATDFFLHEIAKFSQGIVATLANLSGAQLMSIAYRIMLEDDAYVQNLPLVKAFFAERISIDIISDIFEELSEDENYKTCVEGIRVNRNSQMSLLLGGIINDLPY